MTTHTVLEIFLTVSAIINIFLLLVFIAQGKDRYRLKKELEHEQIWKEEAEHMARLWEDLVNSAVEENKKLRLRMELEPVKTKIEVKP